MNKVPGKTPDDDPADPRSLAARLAAIDADFRNRLPVYTATMDAAVARLVLNGAGSAAPGIGDIFPDLVLPDATGRLWRLADALQNGPVVLAFHRGFWCNFCIENMTSLAAISPEIRRMGGQIVAISPENAAHSGQLATQAGAAFPILCDIGLAVSTLLGLSYVVPDDMRAELLRGGDDITIGNGGEGWLLPISATFVIAADGRVMTRHLNPDPRLRMDPDAILQAAAICQSAARS